MIYTNPLIKETPKETIKHLKAEISKQQYEIIMLRQSIETMLKLVDEVTKGESK